MNVDEVRKTHKMANSSNNNISTETISDKDDVVMYLREELVYANENWQQIKRI